MPANSGSPHGWSRTTSLPTPAELARRLADGPALAYATTKMLLSRELDMDLTGAIELEAIAQAMLMTSEDHASSMRRSRQAASRSGWPVTSAHRSSIRALARRPVGFSHAVVAGPGRTVYLAGQTGNGRGADPGDTGIVEQFDARRQPRRGLAATGGRPEDLVSMQIFVTDEPSTGRPYPTRRGVAQHFGRHYPAMALFEVDRTLRPARPGELVAVAVVPENA